MAERESKPTRATRVAQQMRDDILYGPLHPGERLMFPDLCRQYEASVGAIREALVSLTAQGLVKAQAHQGYVVTPLSEGDLLGLTSARLAIEPVVLREAVREGDLAWEGRVVTTHHMMSRIPRESDDRKITDEWVAAHEAFHAALFSGCTNRRLLAIVHSFAEAASLYRRWSMPLETHRDVATEHVGIMDAALDRDADLASDRLCDHIQTTTRLLVEHAHEFVAD
jgi:DNA-binding GntR family transcriptional regulator